MEEEKKGYLSIPEAVTPEGLKTFFVSKSHVEQLLKCGPQFAYWGLQSAAEVLRNPLIIYKGLKRNGQEEGLCYCGTPKQYGEGWSGPPKSGMVFLVCTTKDHVIFEWRWEIADENNEQRPKDESRRFDETIWTR